MNQKFLRVTLFLFAGLIFVLILFVIAAILVFIPFDQVSGPVPSTERLICFGSLFFLLALEYFLVRKYLKLFYSNSINEPRK